jgi:hypothetical protein
MLSLAKLHAGQQQYYEDAIARGIEEYYLGIGELSGQWVGRGAELLGLSGEVTAEGLDAILDGRDPKTGTRLNAAEPPKIIGYDATFCAPKSVSLLYGLGSPEVATEVRDAHRAAVAAALRAYEDVACRARRGHGGSTVVEADGFVGPSAPYSSRWRGCPSIDPERAPRVTQPTAVTVPGGGSRCWATAAGEGPGDYVTSHRRVPLNGRDATEKAG